MKYEVTWWTLEVRRTTATPPQETMQGELVFAHKATFATKKGAGYYAVEGALKGYAVTMKGVK